MNRRVIQLHSGGKSIAEVDSFMSGFFENRTQNIANGCDWRPTVAVALTDILGRILVVRSPKMPKNEGWKLLQGGINEHESVARAACREVHEELGPQLGRAAFRAARLPAVNVGSIYAKPLRPGRKPRGGFMHGKVYATLQLITDQLFSNDLFFPDPDEVGELRIVQPGELNTLHNESEHPHEAQERKLETITQLGAGSLELI